MQRPSRKKIQPPRASQEERPTLNAIAEVDFEAGCRVEDVDPTPLYDINEARNKGIEWIQEQHRKLDCRETDDVEGCGRRAVARVDKKIDLEGRSGEDGQAIGSGNLE